MVAAKGRLNPVACRATQIRKMSDRGEANNLKIYVEDDEVKTLDTLGKGTKGKSIPYSSGSYRLNVNDSKSGVKNLEKRKIKTDKSVDANVGRKVLADIGNVKGNFSGTEQRKNSRAGKGKSEMMLCPQRKGKSETILNQERHAVDVGNMKTSSSDKSSRENVRLGPFQSIGDNQTSRKSVNENKPASNGGRTKFCGRISAAETKTEVGRKSVRKPLNLTRRSLPVLEQVNQVETSSTAKENSEKLSNLRGKHGFPVKPVVRTSIVPKANNLSSRPWGNRVSDGFVAMASRAQTKLNDKVPPRKSVKPTEKKTITVNNQRNSKSNHMSTAKNLRSRPSDLSKRNLDKDSVPKNVPSVVSHGEAPELVISGVTNARRKSERRNSYTCSLMSRPKLLKECSRLSSQEILPNIYDDRNHLEVSDYIDDIYQYYWVMEAQNPLLKNYMAIQRDITPQMRGVLINWLIEVHLKFDLMEETLFLTVTLLDRYLSLENIKKNEAQLVGLTALLLASKYEDFWHPRVTDLLSISAETYTRDQMLKMEKSILKKLKFRLNEPTPYVFMLRFLKAAQSDMKFERLAFYLIELCLVEYEAVNYKPSMLCASAIYVARCTMQMTPPWTPLLAKHARYSESQIRECAEMIHKFHKAAKTSLLKVTYGKYTKPNYCKVASMKPLERLPP